MSESEQTARPVAFFWPYLVFPPLPYAVVMATIGIGVANALGGSAASHMLMGFLLSYILLSVPSLVFAWLHRRLYRASGRHRLWPLLGLALGLSVPVWLALLVTSRQPNPTASELGLLALVIVGGAMSLALIGFCAVWLIDRWRKAGATP